MIEKVIIDYGYTQSKFIDYADVFYIEDPDYTHRYRVFGTLGQAVFWCNERQLPYVVTREAEEVSKTMEQELTTRYFTHKINKFADVMANTFHAVQVDYNWEDKKDDELLTMISEHQMYINTNIRNATSSDEYKREEFSSRCAQLANLLVMLVDKNKCI